MSLDNIRQISIKEYLEKIGIKPTNENECKGMYHSPLREDKNASLSVNYIRNVWFDHGLGKGGSIIDLVAQINNCTIAEAISKLEKQCEGIQPDSFPFQRNNDSESKQEPNISILKVMPLTHSSLLQYLNKRCVNIDTAKQHCKEVYYVINNRNYFSVGFQTDKGHWILRNEYFKGCTAMDITTYSNADPNKEYCLVFEGFIDFLSYLSLKNLDNPKINVVILNSTSNLSKAMDFIKSHSKVYTYLDNDEAGRKATLSIQHVCSTVIDQSVKYTKHKDLNEYLKSQQVEVSKKEVKPFKSRLKM